MYLSYKGYAVIYEEENGKIIVKTANYGGIQCSYGGVFESVEALKQYIDDGGWGVGR